jgi:hypothetical protein
MDRQDVQEKSNMDRQDVQDFSGSDPVNPVHHCLNYSSPMLQRFARFSLVAG